MCIVGAVSKGSRTKRRHRRTCTLDTGLLLRCNTPRKLASTVNSSDCVQTWMSYDSIYAGGIHEAAIDNKTIGHGRLPTFPWFLWTRDRLGARANPPSNSASSTSDNFESSWFRVASFGIISWWFSCVALLRLVRQDVRRTLFHFC